MKRMTDITPKLLRKLETIKQGQGDRGPWCLCTGQLGTLTVGAAGILAGGQPETACQRCGKPMLLIVVVEGGEAGRDQVAQLAEGAA